MQKKNSFDKATLKKVATGALIAGGGAMALYVLDFVQALELNDPVLTSFVAWFVPVAINAVKEWMKGN
jgi:hypothetical protein